MLVTSWTLTRIASLAQSRIEARYLSSESEKLRFRFAKPESEWPGRNPIPACQSVPHIRRVRVFVLESRDEIETSVRVYQPLSFCRSFWREIWFCAITAAFTVSTSAWGRTAWPRFPSTPNGEFTFKLRRVYTSGFLVRLPHCVTIFISYLDWAKPR